MCASDVYGVDVGDCVQEIVRLVNYDDVPLQFDTHGFPSGTMEQGVVGKHHQLGVGVVSGCG